MILLASILAWLPAIGSGPSGEFLLRSDAAEVVGLIGTRLEGSTSCYFVVRDGAVFVRNSQTGRWDGEGDLCQIKAQKRGAWVALSITFSPKWTGRRTVYLLERPGAQWYRAGVWEVKAEEWPWLPPVSEEKPPSLPRMVKEVIKVDATPGSLIWQLPLPHTLQFFPAVDTLMLVCYQGPSLRINQFEAVAVDPQSKEAIISIPDGRIALAGDQIILVYWTTEPKP